MSANGFSNVDNTFALLGEALTPRKTAQVHRDFSSQAGVSSWSTAPIDPTPVFTATKAATGD